ncbi:60S ribosomal protein L14, partial [Physocladia obscura]
VFTRFVEVGRVVLLNHGPDAGKIAVIVDIVDHGRVCSYCVVTVDSNESDNETNEQALVDGPTTGAARQVVSFKRVSLTDIVVDVPRTAGTVAVKKALTTQDLTGKWAASAWAKKLAVRDIRKNLSDFDRFKILIAKKQKRQIVGQEFAKLRRAALKANKL